MQLGVIGRYCRDNNIQAHRMSTEKQLHAFHLAIPTNDLAKARHFYGQILQCAQGRTDPARWIDYNFYGSQVVCHFASSDYHPATHFIGSTPIPNYGVYVTQQQLNDIKLRLTHGNIQYNIIACNDQKISEIVYVQDPTGNNILFYGKK